MKEKCIPIRQSLMIGLMFYNGHVDKGCAAQVKIAATPNTFEWI